MTGTWEIRAEDTNCDMGGPHHQTLLGYYRGRYIDVVESALDMPGFFAWGYGGDINEIKVEPLTGSKTKQLKEAKKELKEVDKRKDDLEKKIDWLTLGGTA